MNEILKEFKIVFGLDSKNLDQGIKRSESNLKSFARTINSIAATYFSYKMLQGIISGFADFNTGLGQSVKMLGVNVESVSALGGALKRYGGDTQSAVNSLSALNKGLQDAKFGGGALIEVAKRYGVNFQKSNGQLMQADELLMSLSKQMQRFDLQTQQAIGSSLGLDDSLIRAFADGGEALSRLIQQQRKYGVSTSEDVKISTEFNNTILDLKDSWNGVIRLFSRMLLPLLTKIFKAIIGFIEFLKKHKELVIAFFAGMVLAMTPLLAIFAKMAIASVAAFAPFYAVGAVVAAIALVVEDIYGYFKGWDTVTGDLVKKFPALKTALEFIKPLVMGIFDTFEGIVAWLKDPSWDRFVNIFKIAGNAIVEFIKKPLELVQNLLTGIFDRVKGFFTDNLFGFSGDAGVAAQAPVVSGGTTNYAGNTYNVSNSVTNNITNATPQALADQYNNLISSVNNQRMIVGRK